MKFFIQTSNNSIVFLLFFTVWTDLLLPKQYKNSDLAFWVWTIFIYTWYYFAFKHLYQKSQKNLNIKVTYNLALIILLVSTSLHWGFGINVNQIGYFQLICYIYLAITLTILMSKLEGNRKLNFESILTFFLIFILPVGAWWIHKRIQNICLNNNEA